MPRSVAAASEAPQPGTMIILHQRNVATLTRFTRVATSAPECEGACFNLANLLEEADCRPTTEELAEAVETVVEALHAWPTSTGVQLEGCHVLALLCETSQARSEARTLAGVCGAMPAVVASLRAHVANAHVVHAASVALASLTYTCPENCTRAHRAGALFALLDVMRAHPMHEAVQIDGCTAIGSLCTHAAGFPMAAVQLGAPVVIIDVLRSFSDSVKLQDIACRACCRASFGPDC